jgi:hypothetical protein
MAVHGSLGNLDLLTGRQVAVDHDDAAHADVPITIKS